MRVVAGRYHLLSRLGAGGAGTVWRARDELLHREVAVKEVRLSAGPGDRERALADTLHEARAAAALSHPAIITVHDVLAEDGQPWIIMDLLAGRSLADVLREHGPLAPGHVAAVGLRVLDALEAAHARGLLHRDVKPGNVILTDDGEVVLTDFGIAARQGAPDAETASAAARLGQISGSPGFIAPELLRGEHYGPSSDLWSLAATLYAACEGQAPFHRSTPMAAIGAVLTVPPPPPVRSGPLGGLLLALLAKDPAVRPGPPAIRAALAPLATPLPSRRAPLDRAPATVPVRTRKSRTPLLLAALATATAVAVTAFVLLDGTETPATQTPATPQPSPSPATQQPSTSQAAPNTPPPARDQARGRFATAPKPCDLLTSEQAERILSGSRARPQTKPDTCEWLGVFGDSVSVRVAHRRSPQDAEKTFSHLRKTWAAKEGRHEGVFTYTRTLDVRGLGDQAFTYDWLTPIFVRSIVYLRSSNVIITVEASNFETSKLSDRLKKAGADTARAAADNLGKRN